VFGRAPVEAYEKGTPFTYLTFVLYPLTGAQSGARAKSEMAGLERWSVLPARVSQSDSRHQRIDETVGGAHVRSRMRRGETAPVHSGLHGADKRHGAVFRRYATGPLPTAWFSSRPQCRSRPSG